MIYRLTPQARMWGHSVRRLVSHTYVLKKGLASESKAEAKLV